MGVKARLKVESVGWYPLGGGRVVATIEPINKLNALKVNSRGKLSSLRLEAIYSNLDAAIAHRMISASSKFLAKNKFAFPALSSEEIIERPSVGKGGLFFVEAVYENSVAGFSCFAQKSKAAEEVARQACADFLSFNFSRAAVDEHAADQLSLYCALAEGQSSFGIAALSDHLRTNVEIIQKFLPVKFNLVEGNRGARGSLLVQGVGFKPR